MSDAAIITNRDLYLAITKLIQRNRHSQRSLEQYLLCLWRLGRENRASPTFTAQELFNWLSRAFDEDAPAFDENWRRQYAKEKDSPDYFGWQQCIQRQIVDLREMDEKGILRNLLRHFDIRSPRGSQWSNFDPCGFLECAAVGTFGGWDPQDSTGRTLVPGNVAVTGPDGKIEFHDAKEIPRPVFEINPISWDGFRTFLYNGQMYE